MYPLEVLAKGSIVKITSMEVMLAPNADRGVVQAYVSVVFDDMFKVCDIKVIRVRDRIRVVMPSRKEKVHCPKCQNVNCFNARFCNSCGTAQPMTKPETLFHDVVFPKNTSMKRHIETEVLKAYLKALRKE